MQNETKQYNLKRDYMQNETKQYNLKRDYMQKLGLPSIKIIAILA